MLIQPRRVFKKTPQPSISIQHWIRTFSPICLEATKVICVWVWVCVCFLVISCWNGPGTHIVSHLCSQITQIIPLFKSYQVNDHPHIFDVSASTQSAWFFIKICLNQLCSVVSVSQMVNAAMTVLGRRHTDDGVWSAMLLSPCEWVILFHESACGFVFTPLYGSVGFTSCFMCPDWNL